MFTNLVGEMAERLKALDSKSSLRVTVTGVRIPLSPFDSRPLGARSRQAADTTESKGEPEQVKVLSFLSF